MNKFIKNQNNFQKPVFLKKEKLSPVNMAENLELDSGKLAAQAEKLRQVILDPNQAPIMEVFIELE